MANIRIGKNVIETLTSGMYDARFVYREYVQNSADQIDKAVAIGLALLLVIILCLIPVLSKLQYKFLYEDLVIETVKLQMEETK